MSEQRNVFMSLFIETDQDPADVQLAVLALISDRYNVVHNSVSASDSDTGPSVAFVICPVRGLLHVFVDDPDRATGLAKKEGAVIVEWAADTDHRGEVTA